MNIFPGDVVTITNPKGTSIWTRYDDRCMYFVISVMKQKKHDAIVTLLSMNVSQNITTMKANRLNLLFQCNNI